MFIVLKTEETANGFFKRKKQQKILQKTEPVSYSTENGLHFFVLRIPGEMNAVSLASTAEKCGRYVSRVIAPRNLLLPDNGKVKRFTPVYSNGLFNFNTALSTIKKAKLRSEEICITVIDRNARMNGEIHRLLPYASSVRAVTSRPERYCNECNRIYDDCGASVMVRANYRPVRKKEIVICCDGTTTAEMKNSAVFSFRQNKYGKLRFFSEKISLSENHGKIIPDNIDPVHFAAAVTELCASTEYKSSIFSHTESSCGRCADTTVSDCLQCYASNKAINA